MEGSGNPGLTADKLLFKEGLILSYTTFIEDDKVPEALQVSASGYLLKDVVKEELKAAIHAAVEDRTTLHPDVQHLLAQQLAAPKASSPLDALTDTHR